MGFAFGFSAIPFSSEQSPSSATMGNVSILLGPVLNVPFFDFRVLIFGENKCKNQFFAC